MFTEMSEHIKLPREDRRRHLDLSSQCIEIGGYDSKEYRGLLAHFLKTTIPTRIRPKICLCHACNNAKCSNPVHLYWGTTADNILDMKEAGKWKSFHANSKAKHGELEYQKLLSMAGKKGGEARRASKN